MAKGTSSKQDITEKILEIFPGSFQYDKEIRIPMIESGEEIQIKCVLTCAKTNVLNENENILDISETWTTNNLNNVNTIINEPSLEEKQKVADLIAKLGI